MWNDHELSKMVEGGVPFHMAADQAGNVGRAFGVWDESQGIELRGRFIIDPDGVIRLRDLSVARLAVVADALRRTVADEELFTAWLGPVRDAIRESFGDLGQDDVQGFSDRIPRFLESLPGVYGEMDTAAFEKNLSGAMLAAVVNGYTDARPFV
jgi:hypothetical protein